MNLMSVIISNMFVATVIGCLAWLVGRSGRHVTMAHLLWVAVLVKLVTPPIVRIEVEFPATWLPASVTSNRVAAGSMASDVVTAPIDASPIPTMPLPARDTATLSPSRTSFIDYPTLLISVWATGVLVLVIRGLLRFALFYRLVRNEGCIDDEATEFVAGLLAKSSGRNPTDIRGPDVLRVPMNLAPMLFGLAHRTMIVCPELLWRSLTVNERQDFLAHETAHFRRRDHWIRWGEWMVSVFYWWLPPVYFVRRQLERCEEACCDAWAVRQLSSSPRQYAETLLKVVDFVSEYRAGIPRFASGMQPTDFLEERLRLVMQSEEKPAPRRACLVAGFLGLTCVTLHPEFQPRAIANLESIPQPATPLPVSAERNAAPSRQDVDSVAEIPIELPAAPKGFWNSSPRRQWAEFGLSLREASVTAEVDRGITITTPDNGSPLRFSGEDVRCIVDLPESGRIVIGSHDGSIRVWDLTAGTPVSLVGRHSRAVTSLAWHSDGGLISADASGTVVKWDIQSGQVLASAAVEPTGVQSVRFAKDGSTVAVLSGTWHSTAPRRTVRLFESGSLEEVLEWPAPADAAVVISSGTGQWLAVAWSGRVVEVPSLRYVGRILKTDVSAMAFSQDALAEESGL